MSLEKKLLKELLNKYDQSSKREIDYENESREMEKMSQKTILFSYLSMGWVREITIWNGELKSYDRRSKVLLSSATIRKYERST